MSPSKKFTGRKGSNPHSIAINRNAKGKGHGFALTEADEDRPRGGGSASKKEEAKKVEVKKVEVKKREVSKGKPMAALPRQKIGPVQPLPPRQPPVGMRTLIPKGHNNVITNIGEPVPDIENKEIRIWDSKKDGKYFNLDPEAFLHVYFEGEKKLWHWTPKDKTDLEHFAALSEDQKVKLKQKYLRNMHPVYAIMRSGMKVAMAPGSDRGFIVYLAGSYTSIYKEVPDRRRAKRSANLKDASTALKKLPKKEVKVSGHEAFKSSEHCIPVTCHSKPVNQLFDSDGEGNEAVFYVSGAPEDCIPKSLTDHNSDEGNESGDQFVWSDGEKASDSQLKESEDESHEEMDAGEEEEEDVVGNEDEDDDDEGALSNYDDENEASSVEENSDSDSKQTQNPYNSPSAYHVNRKYNSYAACVKNIEAKLLTDKKHKASSPAPENPIHKRKRVCVIASSDDDDDCVILPTPAKVISKASSLSPSSASKKKTKGEAKVDDDSPSPTQKVVSNSLLVKPASSEKTKQVEEKEDKEFLEACLALEGTLEENNKSIEPSKENVVQDGERPCSSSSLSPPKKLFRPRFGWEMMKKLKNHNSELGTVKVFTEQDNIETEQDVDGSSHGEPLVPPSSPNSEAASGKEEGQEDSLDEESDPDDGEEDCYYEIGDAEPEKCGPPPSEEIQEDSILNNLCMIYCIKEGPGFGKPLHNLTDIPDIKPLLKRLKEVRAENDAIYASRMKPVIDCYVPIVDVRKSEGNKNKVDKQKLNTPNFTESLTPTEMSWKREIMTAKEAETHGSVRLWRVNDTNIEGAGIKIAQVRDHKNDVPITPAKPVFIPHILIEQILPALVKMTCQLNTLEIDNQTAIQKVVYTRKVNELVRKIGEEYDVLAKMEMGPSQKRIEAQKAKIDGLNDKLNIENRTYTEECLIPNQRKREWLRLNAEGKLPDHPIVLQLSDRIVLQKKEKDDKPEHE